MKKLTLEQAENSPNRIPYRKHINKNNEFAYNDWDRYNRSSISMRWIHGFINKFVNHSYNECYSKFLDRLSKERIYRNSYWKHVALDYFGYEFNKSKWSIGDFYIDKQGRVQKIQAEKVVKPVKYRAKVYKLNLRSIYDYEIFRQTYGSRIYNQIMDTYLTEEQFTKLYQNDNTRLFIEKMKERGYKYPSDWYWNDRRQFEGFFTIKQSNPIILTEKEEIQNFYESRQRNRLNEIAKEKEQNQKNEESLKKYGRLLKAKQKAVKDNNIENN